jgi:oxalate---CoA ligase
MPGRRLDQVDAIRPVKQAGVVSTHVLLFFAPVSAAVASGAAVTLLHVSRDAFFFVSACMLTYAYTDLRRAALGSFYWRRFVSVGIPYLCWTAVYYLYLLPTAHYATVADALMAIPHLLYTGYYHLYFLLVIMQFYLVFPLLVVLLRRTRGHHGLVLAGTVLAQVLLSIAMHWQVLPSGLTGVWAQREAPTYLLYLVGGSLVAFHLTQADQWVRRHARLVIALTIVAALAAEGVYFLAQAGVTTVLGSTDDPFQPSIIAFNVGAIACVYLAGAALVRPERSRRTRAVVRVGADNAYGIYLSQLIFINALVWLHWEQLTATVPWPLLCLATVVIVYLSSAALTGLLARTPLAVPLTGRKQQPWATLLPRRAPAQQGRPDRQEGTVPVTATSIGGWIDQAAARHGSAAYLEDARGTRLLTYAELRDAVLTWVRCLDDAGIATGDRVAIRVSDPLEYATALVAIAGAGRVAVPLDPAAPATELARMLAVAQPRAVACDSPEGLPPGLTVLRPPQMQRPQVRPDEQPDATSGTSMASTSMASLSRAGGIFLSTSGTTGTPKGIALREDQLCHVAAAVAGHHRLTPADRGYCCLPLFHVNAEVVGLLATLSAGACLVLDRRFSRAAFWQTICERRITWVNAVPAIITLLLLEPGTPRPHHVRFVRSASAPLPAAILQRFEEGFGIPVIETYGMTEAASMITANPLDGPRKAGSVGLPVGTEIRIAPSPGRGPAAAAGRVQIRGPGVIQEYAKGGRAGAIDPDGWLDTGDLGHLDKDGYLFLAGRSDDVINRGGEKIYPREIEDFLLAQHGVLSAAVIAVPDDVLGQRPVAYVVPARTWAGHDMEHALRGACDAALPRYKRPSKIALVETLPLGPTGKVARQRLRELARG